MQKRTINAKNIIEDIRSHMTDVQLMEKYQLTAKGLQGVINKLVQLNLLSKSDLDVRPVGYEDTITIDLGFLKDDA